MSVQAQETAELQKAPNSQQAPHKHGWLKTATRLKPVFTLVQRVFSDLGSMGGICLKINPFPCAHEIQSLGSGEIEVPLAKEIKMMPGNGFQQYCAFINCGREIAAILGGNTINCPRGVAPGDDGIMKNSKPKDIVLGSVGIVTFLPDAPSS
jgi:hypothetical protein